MAALPDLKAFENVRDQIGSCGIWCGSCVVGNGALRELSRRYRQLVTDYGLARWGPADIDFGEFVRALESLERIPVCPGCGQGGGKEDCPLRACATATQTGYCSECRAPAACAHAQLLEHMRSGARKAGLFVEAGEVPRPELVEQWSAELRATWPACILFARS